MGNDAGTVIYGAPNLANHAEENAEAIHERMCSVVLACRPSSVLEIGAGRGKLGARFAEHGIRYVGLEPVPAEIDEARRTFPSLRIIQASCYDDPKALGLVRSISCIQTTLLNICTNRGDWLAFLPLTSTSAEGLFAVPRITAATSAICYCLSPTVGIITTHLSGMADISSSFPKLPCNRYGRRGDWVILFGVKFPHAGCGSCQCTFTARPCEYLWAGRSSIPRKRVSWGLDVQVNAIRQSTCSELARGFGEHNQASRYAQDLGTSPCREQSRRNSPTIGSLPTARRANGNVLTKKQASTSAEAGTAGRIIRSKANASSRAGANRSWTFMSCGVWLSFTALLGFFLTASTRQKANLYFFLRYRESVSGCVW